MSEIRAGEEVVPSFRVLFLFGCSRASQIGPDFGHAVCLNRHKLMHNEELLYGTFLFPFAQSRNLFRRSNLSTPLNRKTLQKTRVVVDYFPFFTLYTTAVLRGFIFHFYSTHSIAAAADRFTFFSLPLLAAVPAYFVKCHLGSRPLMQPETTTTSRCGGMRAIYRSGTRGHNFRALELCKKFDFSRHCGPFSLLAWRTTNFLLLPP